jgi:hypothetical protein
MPGDHLFEFRNITFFQSIGNHTAGCLPIKKRADDSVFAMQENCIEHQTLLGEPLGLIQPVGVIFAGAAVKLHIPIRVAPAQVNDQCLARQIMGEDAFGA